MLRPVYVRRLHMHVVHCSDQEVSSAEAFLPAGQCLAFSSMPQTGTPAADTGPMGPDEGPRTNG